MEDAPVSIEVESFEWDEDNIGHLHASVTVAMVEEARDNNPIYLMNRPGRTATHVMIGKAENRMHVPILEVRDGLWRPVTGWRSRGAYQLWNKHRG